MRCHIILYSYEQSYRRPNNSSTLPSPVVANMVQKCRKKDEKEQHMGCHSSQWNMVMGGGVGEDAVNG